MVPTVSDLATNHQFAGVLQQAAVRRTHDQGRHQVLEHRPRPRDEHGATRHGCDGAAEPEPLAGRHVALGDGEEARQPRLGRKQVVAIGVQCPFFRQEADGQQLALGIPQKSELHFQRHAAGGLRDGEQPRRQGRWVGSWAGAVTAMAFDRPVQGRGPIRQVRRVRLAVRKRRRQRSDRLRVRGEAGEGIFPLCLCQSGADGGKRGAEFLQFRWRRA